LFYIITNALKLVVDVSSIASIVIKCFNAHCLHINTALNKTNIALTFRGPGAVEARAVVPIVDGNLCVHVDTLAYGNIAIPTVSKYPHVGSIHSSNHSQFPDTSKRAASGNASLSDLSQWFRSSALLTSCKVHLLKTFVFSSLLYNFGSFTPGSKNVLKKPRGVYNRSITSAVSARSKGKIIQYHNVNALCKTNGILLFDFALIHIRLVYFARFLASAPDTLKSLVSMEYA